jgi:TctA family transporter
MLGGLFGAALLAFSIPVLRPIVLFVGSPELLAICVFGLSLVAVLSSGAVLKGLAAATIGLLAATTGDDAQTGTLRWTFGALYLWDGIPIVPVALGLFAIPELADLVIGRKAIAANADAQHHSGQWQGIKDVLANKFLVLRCAFIGAGLGSIPGIGASVIDWIAYGHAARSERNTETFGQGDIRGVIASEASNNAKEGGALVPTIAFGVPGTASMVLILGAFMIHNIIPGPEMLTTRLDVTYTLVWSVALANIFGGIICFMAANQLAKIALIRIGILAPVVLSVVFIGAFQASRDWGDFYVMFLVGLLGWVMKRLGWPRPPLVLGFVLGGLIENYMFISVERYGWDWMQRPAVIIILLITLYGVLRPIVRGMIVSKRQAKRRARRQIRVTTETVFTVVIIAVFIAAFVQAGEWEFGALLVPRLICGAGLIFTGTLLFSQLFLPLPTAEAPGDENEEKAGKPVIFDITEKFEGLETQEMLRRAANFAAWCLGMLGVAALIGLLPSMLVFLVSYIHFQGKESWTTTFSIAGGVWIVSWALFEKLLDVHWPHSLIGTVFPGLRASFSIF